MSVTDLTGFNTHAAPESAPPMPAGLELDPAKYESDLADFDLTDAQKAELLATLWSVMRTFVELGFSVDICGKLLAIAHQSSHVPGSPVESENACGEAPNGPQGGTP